MAFGDDAFGDVFGEANAAVQHLYDYATQDAPGSVAADVGARIAHRHVNRSLARLRAASQGPRGQLQLQARRQSSDPTETDHTAGLLL